jgi:hypothetical protein
VEGKIKHRQAAARWFAAGVVRIERRRGRWWLVGGDDAAATVVGGGGRGRLRSNTGRELLGACSEYQLSRS